MHTPRAVSVTRGTPVHHAEWSRFRVLTADTNRSAYTGRLTAQVRWLGLRVDGRLALFYIHQVNRVNSLTDLVTMMTAL